ncbi:uncharacterized protein LOC108594727 [Drosophila busckii]|uniref:uncharacterized protein LOC108594727 n=1 Tax=Drosophila busckii TaxID=30019 RepID=UPI00083EB9D6|nr:uncharacterized protein LOC108594727 [Drosophila busckii]
MTNAVCESQNKSWVTIQRCRLRAISRNVTTLNVELELLHPAHNVDLRLELQRRDSTGYKPWIFNYTIDACVFIRQQRHAVFKMFWQIVRNFSTINHNCPYTLLHLMICCSSLRIRKYAFYAHFDFNGDKLATV